jgi:hypothetical protein
MMGAEIKQQALGKRRWPSLSPSTLFLNRKPLPFAAALMSASGKMDVDASSEHKSCALALYI